MFKTVAQFTALARALRMRIKRDYMRGQKHARVPYLYIVNLWYVLKISDLLLILRMSVKCRR